MIDVPEGDPHVLGGRAAADGAADGAAAGALGGADPLAAVLSEAEALAAGESGGGGSAADHKGRKHGEGQKEKGKARHFLLFLRSWQKRRVIVLVRLG